MLNIPLLVDFYRCAITQRIQAVAAGSLRNRNQTTKIKQYLNTNLTDY